MRNVKEAVIVGATCLTVAANVGSLRVPEFSEVSMPVTSAPPVHQVLRSAQDDAAERPRVAYWIERFTTDQRASFAAWIDRMDAFAPLIESKLDQRGMPRELVYLAMIESGFNPKAQSPAKAKGLWQFIAQTAERYGLTVNRKVDERVDPEKSTDAALAYLSDLYDRFGAWTLAAAAYNAGENRVARVMRQVTGSERGSESDFFEIAALLPKETQDYVPRILAAAQIAKQPEKYGFNEEGQS
jgi:membrane-bound lytic murein transglycosylase D